MKAGSILAFLLIFGAIGLVAYWVYQYATNQANANLSDEYTLDNALLQAQAQQTAYSTNSNLGQATGWLNVINSGAINSAIGNLSALFGVNGNTYGAASGPASTSTTSSATTNSGYTIGYSAGFDPDSD